MSKRERDFRHIAIGIKWAGGTRKAPDLGGGGDLNKIPG